MKRIQKLLCFYGQDMWCVFKNISCLLTLFKYTYEFCLLWPLEKVGCCWHVPGSSYVSLSQLGHPLTVCTIYPSILILIVWKLSSPLRIVNMVGVRIVRIPQFCSSLLHEQVVHAAAESMMDLAMGNHHFPSSTFRAADEKMDLTGHMTEDLLNTQLEIFRTGVQR